MLRVKLKQFSGNKLYLQLIFIIIYMCLKEGTMFSPFKNFFVYVLEQLSIQFMGHFKYEFRNKCMTLSDNKG